MSATLTAEPAPVSVTPAAREAKGLPNGTEGASLDRLDKGDRRKHSDKFEARQQKRLLARAMRIKESDPKRAMEILAGAKGKRLSDAVLENRKVVLEGISSPKGLKIGDRVVTPAKPQNADGISANQLAVQGLMEEFQRVVYDAQNPKRQELAQQFAETALDVGISYRKVKRLMTEKGLNTDFLAKRAVETGQVAPKTAAELAAQQPAATTGGEPAKAGERPEEGEQAANAKTPVNDIQTERTRLAQGEGIGIAGRRFNLAEGASDADVEKMFVEQIGNMIDKNVDPNLIEYAILEAQLAGLSAGQLRGGLHTNLTTEVTRQRPGVDGKTETYQDREPNDTQRKLIARIGLPETLGEVQEKSREQVAQGKKELLLVIIKENLQNPKHPPIDESLSREEIFSHGRPILEAAMNGSRAGTQAQDVIQAMLKVGSADDIALVIANENELQGSDPFAKQRESVLKKIKARAHRNPLLKDKLKTATPDERNLIIVREQMAAVLANEATLKKIEKEYNKLLPLWYTILQLLGSVVAVTALDLVKEQTVGALEGRG